MKPHPVCPTCKKATNLAKNNIWRPFCCERCKLIDLGAWIEETHRIPDTENTDEFMEDIDPQSRH